MVKQTIRIFCRVKPTKQPVGLYEVENDNAECSMVSFFVPKDIADGYVNNKKENYKFSFDQIFDQQTKQDEVFKNVAEPVINNVISGFNGTIFAYGQTGSGKTFTITGGAERYIDRGIIPRTLSYIFEKSAENANLVYTIHVSYLEIYNESGYDLLDPKHEASKLEDLPKVSLLEDNDGNIHLRNLSMHQATNEEEALNLLFLGDTNRMIAETPMNQASTRSHCIFTIHVSVRETDSATIRRSKLHLVDLAGSERVSKTGVGGTLLKEAKYINLSLHHLELVILALSEKARSHIPYRTSMMTSVLRDSLGGNCMTSMIATCSVEKKNVDESISTCRFAQRVAMIKNDATLNEELDPQLMIAKLKREIQQLKDELSLVKGGEYEGELDDEEKEKLRELVRTFVDDQDKEALLSVGADMRKVYFCFQILKSYCVSNVRESARKSESPETSRSSARSMPGQQPADSSYLYNTTEMQKLKDLILQRDNEINILVGMLKKEKKRAKLNGQEGTVVDMRPPKSSDSVRTSDSYDMQRSNHNKDNNDRTTPEDKEQQRGNIQAKPGNVLLRNLNHKNKASMSVGRQEAFESFVRDYPENELIEENKRGLRMRYSEAKKLGEKVNAARHAINTLKGKLEKLKIRRSLQAAAGTHIPLEEDDEELLLRNNLDQQKNNYKKAFNQLKALKTEIEHMQFLMEKSKVKLQKDFELWWAEQVVAMESNADLKSDIKTAWRTPPLTPATAVTSSTPKYENNNRNREQPTSWNTGGKPNHSLRSNGKASSELRESSTSSSSSSRNAFLTNISDSKTNASVSSSTPNGRTSTSSIRLTGDAKTDEDIMAFMKARQQLMRKSQK